MEPGAPLPAVVSVPHGGTIVPKDFKAYSRLSLPVILRDNDTWAREIFSVAPLVAFYVESAVARAAIDMNRHPHDRPPQNPDGVVKTVTVFGEQVWEGPAGLTAEQADRLIAEYHRPFHEKLRQASQSGKAFLGIDCHTMLSVGPPGSPRAGEKRPLICLSNRGGEEGCEQGEPVTAPALLVHALRDALCRHFKEDIDAFLERGGPHPAIAINSPFRGGYIIKSQSAISPIPWLMLELNRCLYLSSDTPLTAIPLPHVENRLRGIRKAFMGALSEVLR